MEQWIKVEKDSNIFKLYSGTKLLCSFSIELDTLYHICTQGEKVYVDGQEHLSKEDIRGNQ